ncbi:DUF3221 domain-containing protein [Sporosarcina sp. FSL K6-6792]|uniref:DUF3221 domain-containing protein n=1 Tax=Sporosarcina sp. FSL K6-6792 TaxID=2921559 RepID=UPI0030FADA39
MLTGYAEDKQFNNSSSDNIIDTGYVVKVDGDRFLFTSKSMIKSQDIEELNSQIDWKPTESLTWEQRTSSVWLPMKDVPGTLTVGDKIDVSYYTQLDSNPQFGGFNRIKIVHEN